MKATHTILVSFILAILLVVSALTVSLWSYRQIESALDAQESSEYAISEANALLSAVINAETGQRGFILTGKESFLEPYLTARKNIPARIKKLKASTNTAEAKKHVAALEPLINSKLVHTSNVIELRRNQDINAATALVSAGEGKRLMDAIRTEIAAFISIQQSSLGLRKEALKSKMRFLFNVILGAATLWMLFAIAFIYLNYQRAQQRIKNLVHLETKHLLDVQHQTTATLQQANLTLVVSEEKLRITLSSIGDAVIATDSFACVTLLNIVAEQLTGWKQADAIGRPIAEVFNIINKNTRQAVAIPVLDSLVHGTIQGLTNHTILIARDGNECDIADSCAPIRDTNGQIIGAVLVFRNVTEERAVKQALQDSATFVQTVLNTTTDGILCLHANNSIIEKVNPATEQMFGYSELEIHGQKLSFLIPELFDEEKSGSLDFYKASDEARSSGLGREVQGQRKDGSMFPMEIAVSEMCLNDELYFTSILRDISVRKQVEDALLKAGALQRAIFNSANFSSIATDAKGVIQIFNVGAERMLGYAAADVMNTLTPADISDPDEVIARAEALSHELGTPIQPGFDALAFKASRGIEDIYELTYIRKDGTRFPALVSVTALRDANENIIGYLLIGTDNTARKQAEADLLKAGALQRAIFNSANFSSIATDAKGVIQIFNVGAERMLGYAAADVMNIITPADISDPEEVIARAEALSHELGTHIQPGFEALAFKASRGIEDIYELTYIRKDGSRFPALVSVTALRDANENIIGYLLIGTDNTARKQVEAEQKKLDQRLRDQQFYTRSLIEANIDALITTDPFGIITDVNKQMERLTGCTRDELIGAPFKNYFTDPERAEAGIKMVLSKNKVTNYELTAFARNGNETVVSYNATTFFDRDRNLQGVFAAARDISERILLDTALQENNIELKTARQAAEKANLAKSDFLSSMSHELRSPLNAILGFAQLMDTSAPPPSPAQKSSIKQILQAGWYLLELINEVLDLALIESGKLSISPEPISLNEVLGVCEDMIQPLADKNSIRIVFTQPDNNYFVCADRTRFKQVMINLLSNAIKYNRVGGSVEISTKAVSDSRIRISVQDTGEGLSADKLSQLFQPFNRLGQEAGLEEGTGIGLVVSKRLVELMDGEIGAHSTVGVGSVFWIELILTNEPECEAYNTEHAFINRAISPNEGQSTLLYVEDNPANLLLVEKLLERRPDISLFTAGNGTSGVEMARLLLPEVILMDINLPGISGIEAMQILTTDSTTAHIPVIAISANAMPRDIEKGLDAGFFRYLTKPIKVNELIDTLDVVLAHAKASELIRESATKTGTPNDQ